MFTPVSALLSSDAGSYITAHGLATEAGHLTQKQTGFEAFVTARLIPDTLQKSARAAAAVDPMRGLGRSFRHGQSAGSGASRRFDWRTGTTGPGSNAAGRSWDFPADPWRHRD
jgi:hypothetical protein